MIHERRRVDRRRCSLCCWVFRVFVAFAIVVGVYVAVAVANGRFFERASTASGRLPGLNGAHREPVLLGPSGLHPLPFYRLPNYVPRHAS